MRDFAACHTCGATGGARPVDGFVRCYRCVPAKPAEQPAPQPNAADLIAAECDRIKAMLLQKNAAYGNSALDPVRVFSKADAAEQLRVRIDDKLSRLARGSNAGEDVTGDLIGYLVLLRIAERPSA